MDFYPLPKSVFWRAAFVPVVQKNEVIHLYPTGSWTRKYQDPQVLRSVRTFPPLMRPISTLWLLQAQISLAYFCSFFLFFCLFVLFIGFVWAILSN